jgi:hypothetical protein
VQSTEQTNYIACLKWGDKYSPDYVNKLYSMIQRHTTVDHQFLCFTESAKGLHKDINVMPLPKLSVTGWWYKPYMLSSIPELSGTLLFFDLDVVICKNIDSLFAYHPDKFCIIRDFNRTVRPNWDRMNSSVFKTPIGMYDKLWQQYKNNPKDAIGRNAGDQDWMYKNIKDHIFWPDEWIQSYKWEMRNRNELTVVNRKRVFKDKGTPNVKPQTKVAVFHGSPNPADCLDDWVVDNWQ